MSFLERARQQAAQSLNQLTGPEGQSEMRDAAGAMGSQLRDAAGQAKKGIVTMIEKIDPDTLADLIVRATAIQEKANRALHRKESAYRIGEITITATIPPQIGFAITRIGDIEDAATGSGQPLLDSSQIEASLAPADEAVLSLEGETAPTDEA
jgi:hypothetical protein